MAGRRPAAALRPMVIMVYLVKGLVECIKGLLDSFGRSLGVLRVWGLRMVFVNERFLLFLRLTPLLPAPCFLSILFCGGSGSGAS